MAPEMGQWPPLSHAALAVAPPSCQNSYWGERIYSVIVKTYPALAKNITSMIRTLDSSVIMQLLSMEE